MKVINIAALLRGALYAGLVSIPLFAADPEASPSAADSGAGNFYALVLGLMFTLFGGMALCYGFVRLVEKAVERFQARNFVPAAEPPIRRAA